MQENFQKLLIILKIVAFEVKVPFFINYEKKACEPRSTCQKAVLRFQIALQEIINILICLLLMKN